MKKSLLWIAVSTWTLLSALAPAAEELVLNGTGIRTKPILGAMYELSLYLPKEMKGAHPNAIIEDAKPMELSLLIKSSMITRDRFVEATSEGFAKAAESGYASNQTQLFLDQFSKTDFRKGDTIVMRYENDALVTLYRKAETKDSKPVETKLGRIAGPDLKKALFAIWLGNSPVQEALKKSLLGAP